MHITEDEATSLQKFKEVVSDLNQDEGVLIRFLRARDYNIDIAEQLLRYVMEKAHPSLIAMQWRKELNLDNYSLKTWNFPTHWHSALKYRYFGRDYEGAPISWLFIGSWALKQMVEKEDHEQLKRYFYSIMEQGLQETIVCDSPGNVVVDMEGLTYTQATHIPSLKFFYLIFQTFEQCYPETLKSILIINAPWIFSFCFNFVKGIMVQRTLAKVIIFKSKEEWHTDFLKRFPRDSIVPELQPPTN